MQTYSLFSLHCSGARMGENKNWITTRSTISPCFEVFGYVDAETPEEAIEKWAHKRFLNNEKIKVNLTLEDNTDNVWCYTYDVEE